MQKMQILFPEPQLARLRRIAAAEDRPVSELVRGAVDFWLSRYGKPEANAAGESPPTHGCGEILTPAAELRETRACGQVGTMNSIDTSILLYAINRDCPEHEAAIRFVKQAIDTPSPWIVSDQVWFELYRLLRNPVVLSSPLGAAEATDTIEWYRHRSGWLTCAWDPELMPKLIPIWRQREFAPETASTRCWRSLLMRTGYEHSTPATPATSHIRLVRCERPDRDGAGVAGRGVHPPYVGSSMLPAPRAGAPVGRGTCLRSG